MIKEKEKEFIYIRMVIDMRVLGRTIKWVERARFSLIMESFITAIGKRTWKMVMGISSTGVASIMRVNEEMIKSMETAYYSWKTERFIKDFSRWERNMALGNFSYQVRMIRKSLFTMRSEKWVICRRGHVFRTLSLLSRTNRFRKSIQLILASNHRRRIMLNS